VDEIGTELASLARLASQSHPIDFIDSLPHQLETVIDTIDVGLYDLQRRQLISLRDGKPVDPDQWPVSVAVEHHGNHLGRLLVKPAEDDDNVVASVLQVLAPLVALNITSAFDFDDRPWTTIRTNEMSLAAEIQATVVPPPSCRRRDYAISAAVEPAYETGGDIFEYSFDDDRLFLAVLDAMGHGLSAALLASLATAALRRARREGDGLADVVGHVDTAVRAQHNGSAFVSAVMVEIDVNTGRCQWVSAGHLPPLLLSEGNVRELTTEPSLPLGLWVTGDEEPDDVPVNELTLEPDESLVLYSDGIIENLMESSEDHIGDDRFREAVGSHARMFTHRCARDVVEELLKASGSSLRDDATLLIAHRST